VNARALAPSPRPHAMRRLGIACGHFLFLYRDYLFPAVVVMLVLTTTPGAPFGSRRLDHWLDAFGFAVACAGQGCRLLAVGSVEHIRRRGDHKKIAAQSLIHDGIFAYTRNPLYLGNWLIVCGLVLIANNRWWYLVVLPAFSLAYWTIVLAEEDFLARKFGPEYEAYLGAVNRFIPNWRGLVRVLSSPQLAWRRAFGKEARVATSWLSAAILLLVWERWSRRGFSWPLLVCLVGVVFTGRSFDSIFSSRVSGVKESLRLK